MKFYQNTPLVIMVALVVGCANQKQNPDYSLNPKELLKLNELSIDEFDSELARNEYHLVSKEVGETFTTYIYDYNRNSNRGTPFYEVVKYVNSSGENKAIMYMKGGNENYSILKDKIGQMDYKFALEKSYKGRNAFVYEKEGSDQVIHIMPPTTSENLLIVRAIYFRKEPYQLN